ncbi:MAG: hypothetical protein CVU06_11275 [Bacteroidetes bacterium HGW-Bacteroidetes-22]|nr:MAG: hypothetical protein CVU06_11275 [Bacteroidetes bacterium HGW-Bacteroidetes-22]
MKHLLLTGLACFSAILLTAQIDVKGKIEDEAESRTEQRTDEGISTGFDKVEDGIGNLFTKKKKKEKPEKSEEEQVEEPTDDQVETEEQNAEAKPARQQTQKLQSFSKYDFVPGDQILFFEDFSQDAVGDFPALWATNGSGEVKTVNLAQGKWLHMNGNDAVYCYTKNISFPNNFIIELDMIPDEEFRDGIQLTIYEDVENKELDDDLYPGARGLHINIQPESWATLGYNNITNGDWLEGHSENLPVIKETLNHIIIWIQNRRVRIYHKGAKVLDMPTNIYADTKFNRLRFSGWDRHSYPFLSNLKVTSAAPDMRNKILSEGKIISYGIYFDTGKDVVKPESYGSVKEIAQILKENPDLKIMIIGHTDSDGDQAKNLDLSKRRAASVKTYLIREFGAEEARITTDGHGQTVPIAPNSSAEGKAKNRRVEFIRN